MCWIVSGAFLHSLHLRSFCVVGPTFYPHLLRACSCATWISASSHWKRFCSGSGRVSGRFSVWGSGRVSGCGSGGISGKGSGSVSVRFSVRFSVRGSGRVSGRGSGWVLVGFLVGFLHISYFLCLQEFIFP